MEKASWKKIDRNSSKPCPRWGHACCTIGDEVLFFGGYADSNYMNDLWTYHATQRTWTEVITTGQRPSHRSNCSINYDPTTDSVVVFGGGGPNKQRFNSVSILDWKTKVWRQLTPPENQAAPWERTYHVAELKYPYLVVFGGEGLTDMDDLWICDIEKSRWTQVRLGNDATKPCARRFHSSCMIGNQFFVIAGCHSKYRCLSDVYSLDLTPLLQTGKTAELKWNQRKLKSSSFLTRWGHSTAVFDGKIYVFAGRFSSDLNDVLVIDVENNSLKGLKIGGPQTDHPKPRRRHCAAFVGSCMIIFGGFNGEYFNDLHYINVLELKSKPEVAYEDKFIKMLNNEEMSDFTVVTKEGEKVHIHTSVLARYFKNQIRFEEFLIAIQRQYESKDLIPILEALYKGYGLIQDDLLKEFEVELPEYQNRKWLINSVIKESTERTMLSNAHSTSEKYSELIVPLKQQDFEQFMEKRRQLWYSDCELIVDGTNIPVNGELLAMQSPYFRHLFSGQYKNDEYGLELPIKCSPVVIEMILNALMLGGLPVLQDYSVEGWEELAEISQYLCLEDLKAACEMQLCSRVKEENVSRLGTFAEKMDLGNLVMHCGLFELKNGRGSHSQCEGAVKLREWLRLQLAHNGEKVILPKMLKGKRESSCEQKQNNGECSNI